MDDHIRIVTCVTDSKGYSEVNTKVSNQIMSYCNGGFGPLALSATANALLLR